MNRTVWKFPLVIGQTTINIPRTANVRHAGIDPATQVPALWIELDAAAPRIDRRFVIYGTGHDIPGDGGFPSPIWVGTVIDTPFVWHIYEARD